MYDDRSMAKMGTETGYSEGLDVRELEIEREVDILSKSVAELSATCASLENLFSAVIVPPATPNGEVGRPEQSVNTKLGNKIAQIRRIVESTQYALNSFIQRKEV